ncbi:MAG: hypothetical protein QOH70_1970 [Blastocatellia bacterium]|jgi:hypothetical protein|nr:hypothetical protein [Blastocatellia bacterium]
MIRSEPLKTASPETMVRERVPAGRENPSACFGARHHIRNNVPRAGCPIAREIAKAYNPT